MKVIVNGWGRDKGDTTILEADLVQAIQYKRGGYEPDTTYINEEGTVLRRSKNIQLNGNYLVRVELSDTDLLRLVIDRFGHIPFSTILRKFRHPSRSRMFDRLSTYFRAAP